MRRVPRTRARVGGPAAALVLSLLTTPLILGSLAPSAVAQSTGGAQSLLITPAAGGDGAGRAGTTIYRDAAAAWYNPALIARAEHAALLMSFPKTLLVPGLSDDVSFTHTSVVLPAGLAAFAVSRSYLDYGIGRFINETGDVLGTYEPYEWSASVTAALRPLAPFFERAAIAEMLAVGVSAKYVVVDFSGDAGPGDTDDAIAFDAGLQIEADLLALDGRPARVPLTVHLAAAWRNRPLLGVGDDAIDPAQFGDPLPLGRTRTLGIGLSTEAGPLDASIVHERYADRVVTEAKAIGHSGLEISFAERVTARAGYIDDEDGTIEAATAGLGIVVPLPFVDVGFDYARVPQGRFLEEEVDKFGLTLAPRLGERGAPGYGHAPRALAGVAFFGPTSGEVEDTYVAAAGPVVTGLLGVPGAPLEIETTLAVMLTDERSGPLDHATSTLTHFAAGLRAVHAVGRGVSLHARAGGGGYRLGSSLDEHDEHDERLHVARTRRGAYVGAGVTLPVPGEDGAVDGIDVGVTYHHQNVFGAGDTSGWVSVAIAAAFDL